MYIAQNIFRAIGRTALVAAIATVPTLALSAQQDASAVSRGIFFTGPVSTATLIAANDVPDSLGYSSSAGAPETDAAVNFMAGSGVSAAMQPPPRRYGRRPVYADSSHNADGSNKYTFFGGAGFTLPTGGTHAYFSPSYDFQVGGGRNFNKKLALLLQFDWANFGIQSGTRATLGSAAIYGTTVNGHAHDWSFSLDPMYTFAQTESLGAYVIGGVGFYHKYTDFTTPGTGEECDQFGNCFTYTANEDLSYGQYTSNSVGVNGGVGATFKPSRFGNERFYAEARFVYTDNQPKPYFDGTTGTQPASNPNYINIFPQNSAKTTFIPITFGVRF